VVVPSVRRVAHLVNVDRCQYDAAVSDDRWLTAAQATARLRVKPQTLYAYVSRGLVRRERPPGTRTSRYSRADVERLAEHGRPRARERAPEIVIDQAVTSLDPDGHLAYRGWDVTRAATSARYEEVAEWLWGSTIGPNEHWSSDRAELAVARRVQAALPADTPLPDRLRVTVAALRSTDPLRNDRRAASVAARAGTIIATMVKALPPVDARDEPTATGSIARRLWTRVSPLDPSTSRVRALDRALSLLADHELATSTFGVRIAASTWADPYLLLLTGLAVVGGPLHGGASEFVRTLLRDAVATTPETAIGRALRDGEHVPGFGHSVYTGPDPRAPVLLDAIERCKPPRELWRAAHGVLDVMARDRGPYPNIDFALGVLGEATRMVHGAGETIFAVARSAGWIAHGLEEYPHRLRYRIRATYTGPAVDVVG
jgi:citrate synthase